MLPRLLPSYAGVCAHSMCVFYNKLLIGQVVDTTVFLYDTIAARLVPSGT